MHGRRIGAVLVVGVLAAGCSGSKDEAVDTTASITPDSAPTDTMVVADVTTTTTIAATTTTLPPPPQVPAGMQFTGAPVVLPPTTRTLVSDGTTVVATGTVDSTVLTCARGVQGCTRVAVSPVVHVGTPAGGFSTVQVDDITTYPLPSGYLQVNNGLTPVAITKGAAGYVMAGYANIWDSDLFHNVASRAVLWFSPDAATWQRIDLRDVVGDTNMYVRDVQATESGFIAVGEVTGADSLQSPSTGLVLTSLDGVNWTKGPQLALPWSVTLRRAVVHGNQVLLHGAEYQCTTNSSAMNDFSLGNQDRLWGSSDGGVTFTPIDLATTGAAADMPAPPTDASQCGDFGSESEFTWSFGFVDEANGTFVLGSADGSTVSSSTDLATWKTAPLPGGAPTVDTSGSSTPTRGRRIASANDDGLFVLSLEQRRNDEGAQTTFGLQVLGWKSSDGGTTFEALPETRPVKTSVSGLLEMSDGTVALIANTRDPATGVDVPAMFLSTAGPLAPWGSCTPAPAADCAFANFDSSASFAGADLTGIDLSGTTLVGANFDGANLTRATFVGAQLDGATFKNANLTEASLAGLGLTDADFTGAAMQLTDFSNSSLAGIALQGGQLRGAVLVETSFTIDPAVPVNDADLSGMDLADATFAADFGTTGVMQRTNFDGANLSRTSFRNIDLTGSNFADATLVDVQGRSVTFSSAVICPDGAPVDATAIGAASCRL